MLTCGELLVQLLEDLGVDTVFGIPGVHTIELYRGLPATRIRHITPRHEQGAGFMADGYARVSGKPGVCFSITGPGRDMPDASRWQAAVQLDGVYAGNTENRIDAEIFQKLNEQLATGQHGLRHRCFATCFAVTAPPLLFQVLRM